MECEAVACSREILLGELGDLNLDEFSDAFI